MPQQGYFLWPFSLFFLWLFNDFVHFREEVQQCLLVSTKKKCCKLTLNVVSCLYNFFSPGTGGHKRQSPDPCIANGKWGVFASYERKTWILVWDEILSLFHISRSDFCFHWREADQKPLADTLEKGGFLTVLPSLFPSTYGHCLTYLKKILE